MISMRKVYLSKSNQANPDYVSMVRVYLKDKGYEIIEHTGGPYDPRLLLQCKFMVMVGIDRPSSHGEGLVMVGKGQYNQLRERVAHGLDNNIYFSHTVTTSTIGKDEPVFRSVITSGIVDENNWTHGYGRLRCKMSSIRRLIPIASHAKKGADHDVDKSSQHLGGGTVFKTHLACITLFK